MPPRKKNAAPPTAKDLKDTLWKTADKLRGSMDAAQYKDFVLGLVFLKYVSDSFEERREQIREEIREQGIAEQRLDQFLDDKDEYLGQGVFWVPAGARWDVLKGQAKSGNPGALLDAAMDSIMKEN
ncbi:MAG: type I restriction-modification system subunit M N-terminal domain-containing protein, partial [Pseudonocardiaceae bacterium]